MNILAEQIASIIDKDLPLVSNLSNASAILKSMDIVNWAGFYLVDGDRLILGPFQGEVACTIIPIGKGVCGTAFKEKKTIIVKDVNKFDGHIACSSKSKSEIVTPIIKNNEVVAVIDIDSPVFDRFDESNQKILEEIALILAELF